MLFCVALCSQVHFSDTLLDIFFPDITVQLHKNASGTKIFGKLQKRFMNVYQSHFSTQLS